MVITIIPLATFVALVTVFFIIGLLWIRQRRRNQQIRGPVIFPNFVTMPIQPTNSRIRTPMPLNQLILYPNPCLVNPMPVPQPFPPTPIISNASSLPDTPASNLMDRMRQVQILMVEIHRLESESGGERNPRRVQELKQLVMKLSDTDGYELVSKPADTTSGFLQPPPAYVSRDSDNGERPEHGDGSG